MPTNQLLKSAFAGVRNLEIINAKETVAFKSGRGDSIAVDGRLGDAAAAGMSRSDDTLYLVGFDGTIEVPDDVVVTYRRGVEDLQQALFDIYAPSVPYAKFLETSALVESLAPYRDVPLDLAIDITHRFADWPCTFFFVPQEKLRMPPVLTRLERRARADAFQWDGPYPVLSKLQAGQLTTIPEIGSARTTDEVVDFTATFIKNKMAVTGPPRQALLRQVNNVSIEPNLAKLRGYLPGLQLQMAKSEAHVRALATTVTKQNDERLAEGIKGLDKLGIGYGATLVKAFESVKFPISALNWLPIMAEVAAQEVAARSKSGSKDEAPESATTTAAVEAIRDADALENLIKAKQQCAQCLHEDIAGNIRIKSSHVVVEQGEAIKRARQWAGEQKKWEEDAGYHAKHRFERGEKHYHATYTTRASDNRVAIDIHAKEENDEELKDRLNGPPSSIAPSPSPSPAPSPSPSSGEGFLDGAREFIGSLVFTY